MKYKVYLYLFFPCLDAALRATVCKMCATYLAAMIDIYYFSAHSVCLKLAADVPALDMVHLKFSAWVHFLRQTNQPDCRLPVVDVYLLISGRKLSPFHRAELLFLRYLEVTWESVCLLGVWGYLLRGEMHLKLFLWANTCRKWKAHKKMDLE